MQITYVRGLPAGIHFGTVKRSQQISAVLVTGFVAIELRPAKNQFYPNPKKTKSIIFSCAIAGNEHYTFFLRFRSATGFLNISSRITKPMQFFFFQSYSRLASYVSHRCTHIESFFHFSSDSHRAIGFLNWVSKLKTSLLSIPSHLFLDSWIFSECPISHFFYCSSSVPPRVKERISIKCPISWQILY